MFHIFLGFFWLILIAAAARDHRKEALFMNRERMIMILQVWADSKASMRPVRMYGWSGLHGHHSFAFVDAEEVEAEAKQSKNTGWFSCSHGVSLVGRRTD